MKTRRPSSEMERRCELYFIVFVVLTDVLAFLIVIFSLHGVLSVCV